MSERSHHRKPATFKLDDPGVVVMDPDDSSRPSRGTVHVTPEADPLLLPVPVEAPLVPVQRGFRWGVLFWAAIAGLILLGLGLGVTQLIEELFARSEGLGFLGLAFAAAAALAFAVVVVREAFGLARLATIEKLHCRAAAVLLSDDRAESRAIVQELTKLAHQNPHLARARATLQGHADDIIDGADMIRLAERELMTPLEQEARRLVSMAARPSRAVSSPLRTPSPSRCDSFAAMPWPSTCWIMLSLAAMPPVIATWAMTWRIRRIMPRAPGRPP